MRGNICGARHLSWCPRKLGGASAAGSARRDPHGASARDCHSGYHGLAIDGKYTVVVPASLATHEAAEQPLATPLSLRPLPMAGCPSWARCVSGPEGMATGPSCLHLGRGSLARGPAADFPGPDSCPAPAGSEPTEGFAVPRSALSPVRPRLRPCAAPPVRRPSPLGVGGDSPNHRDGPPRFPLARP